MSRSWKTLVILLGAQAALAGAAATLEWTYSCGACRAGGLSLGLVGFAFYTGLFLAAIFGGPTRFLYGAILFGFGIHLMLVAQLLASGLRCWICFAAGGLSLALAALAIACDRANLARMAFILPWSVLLVVGWSGPPRPSTAASPPAALHPGAIAKEETPAEAGTEANDSAAVRLIVFTQPDCPYCDELRQKLMPEIEREFGPRLQVQYRPAADLPAIRRTPTLIVAPGRRDRRSRVIEGLPSREMLRDAIREVEGRP